MSSKSREGDADLNPAQRALKSMETVHKSQLVVRQKVAVIGDAAVGTDRAWLEIATADGERQHVFVKVPPSTLALAGSRGEGTGGHRRPREPVQRLLRITTSSTSDWCLCLCSTSFIFACLVLEAGFSSPCLSYISSFSPS